MRSAACFITALVCVSAVVMETKVEGCRCEVTVKNVTYEHANTEAVEPIRAITCFNCSDNAVCISRNYWQSKTSTNFFLAVVWKFLSFFLINTI